MIEPSDFPQFQRVPARPLVRLGSKFLRGIATVQAQIAPYAEAWNRSNGNELKKDGPTWVVLGDSMAQGVGASSYDNGWVGQLRTLLHDAGSDYRLINLSMSGARVEHVIDEQLPAMEYLDSRPDLITILVGSNDLTRPRYRKQLVTTYRRLLDMLPETTIVVAPLGSFGLLKQLNDTLEDYADTGKITVARNSITNWRGKLAADRFHPNDKGYQDIARIFADAILRK